MGTPVLGSLNRSYSGWRVNELVTRRFSPEHFQEILGAHLFPGASSHDVGSSFEGRPIRVISLGSGPTTVLLWSQMHGDESTATMAIADILNYFRLHSDEESAKTILSSLHLLFLPLLNPDGATRFQRRTAQGIDMNRDALSLQTPEAGILKNIQQEHKPSFGFNLHDQELSTVGTTREVTALSLLAPAFDDSKSNNEVRTRAKQLAAFLAESAGQLAPGKIARYDDTYEPRAFGDCIQRWGTSTVLIESGHTIGDPEKNAVRRMNAVCILAALHAIATGGHTATPVATYESLPFNGKGAYDIIIRNIGIRHGSGTTKADLGISYQVDTHSENPPILVDVGDLRTFVGLREIDGGGKVLPGDRVVIGKAFAWEDFFPG